MRKPTKPTISISRTGRVTLKIDATELGGIIEDAAREEARRTSQPNRETLLKFAKELAEWARRWNDDSADVYTEQDVRDAYSKPLVEALSEGDDGEEET